jgi:hypothetical protein
MSNLTLSITISVVIYIMTAKEAVLLVNADNINSRRAQLFL